MSGNKLHFHKYLVEANIICGLKAKDSQSAISELAERLSKTTGGLDPAEVTKAVMDRERVMPTVISEGLAVPHARLEKLSSPALALGTSRAGIDFNLPGAPPVSVAILILTPKNDPALHLQILSALSRQLGTPSAVKRLSSLDSPKKVLSFFAEADDAMPEFLTARDLMQKDIVTLRESDTLGKVIETFASKRVMDIPIVDEDSDIRGVISFEDILRISLPEHLLWMDDLSPILYFQPFAETLRKDKDTKIADILRDDIVSVDEDVPAIQLAKIFLMKKVRQIIVTRNSKFAGAVNVDRFITSIFWS